MVVVKIADEAVSHKVDTNYISEYFSGVQGIGLVYVCTQDSGDEDDWFENGIRHIVIRLPYNMVKRMSDVRQLMLSKAKERLGLTV